MVKVTISVFNLLLLIINPFWAVICSTFYMLASSKIRFFYPRVLGINLSIFLGVLNSVKRLDSDLFAYHNIYLSAENKTLLQFTSDFSADYFYYAYTYYSYYLYNGSWDMFIIVTTALPYLFIFESVIIVLKKMTVKNDIMILIILNVGLFYPIFLFSGHLVRNSIAATIMLYYITQYYFNKKNKFYLVFIALTIHISSIIFLIIYLFPQKRTHSEIWIKLLVVATLLIFLWLFTAHDFDSVYIVSRLQGFGVAFYTISIIDIVFIFSLTLLIYYMLNWNFLVRLFNKHQAYYYTVIYLSMLYGITLQYAVINGRVAVFFFNIIIPFVVMVLAQRKWYMKTFCYLFLAINIFYFQDAIINKEWYFEILLIDMITPIWKHF
ncbi:MAG: EpsG family protein [Hyphomicrobiales bacterium]